MSQPPRHGLGDDDAATAARPLADRRSRARRWIDEPSPQQPSAPQPAASPPPVDPRKFVEPGRAIADVPQTRGRTPLPPHLDPRLAGLEAPDAQRRRGFRGRSARSVIPPNPPSNGLQMPIPMPRRIAVVGMKGGVGKTVTSLLMARATARYRREPVLLLDADTTYGSLLLRVGLTPIASAHDVAEMGNPRSFHVMQGAISHTDDGVWVLPSGRTPAQSAAFNEATYVAAVRAVYRFFPVMITDCGTGLDTGLMNRVLTATHSLVIAAAPSLDGLLASINALQWLEATGFGALAQRSIIALSNVPDDPVLDLQKVRERFAGKCRAVITIPNDRHINKGGLVTFENLNGQTREAAQILAGHAIEAALEV